MKTTVNINVEDDRLELFRSMYPRCLSRFLSQCVLRACIDRDFFSDIFFSQSLKKEFFQNEKDKNN